MFQNYGFLWANNLKLEIVLLDSLLRLWSGFEDFNILNFSMILLKFAIVFESFVLFWVYFCPFLSLTIITCQRSFSSHADGLPDITPETKNSIEHFYSEFCKLFHVIFCIFLQMFKISFFLFDFFTNKARELKVAESRTKLKLSSLNRG